VRMCQSYFQPTMSSGINLEVAGLHVKAARTGKLMASLQTNLITVTNCRESIVMTRRSSYCVVLGGVVLLAACAETPMGPTVQVMPGPGKSFSSFQNDQAVCRQFAEQAVRDQAQGANLRGLGTAALTTVLGAGLGAAIGGGQGAAIGAAGGALGGAGLGAMRTTNAQNAIQAQYDNAFAQCMFSLGNSVPAEGPMMVQPASSAPP
jgi:hypothetical protein